MNVSVLASGSMAIWMTKGRGAGDEFGMREGFVTQLLAGVGGVGDQFAHENVALGIDRMHHQMQQARNVGLEILRLGGDRRLRRGSGFSRQGIPLGVDLGPKRPDLRDIGNFAPAFKP